MSDSLTEVYVGWDPAVTYDKYNWFAVCFSLDSGFYFKLDAALMYASKGGITLDSLIGKDRVLDLKSKERYHEAFKELYKEINKAGSSSASSDVEMPDGNPVG